jgi:hypothetical protein
MDCLAMDFEEFNKDLRKRGWRYDAENEVFKAGEAELDWEAIIALVPGMTLDELAFYQDDQHDHYRAKRNAYRWQ